MKRIAAFLLAVLAAAACAVCGNRSEPKGEAAPQVADAASTAPTETLPSKTQPSGSASTATEPAVPYAGALPAHEPYGSGVGAMPGRVVWAYDPDAVSWDGDGHWWAPDHFDDTLVLQMANECIAALGGGSDAAAGWSALFTAHNDGTGYQAGEKVAIKANMNGVGVFGDDTSGQTDMSFTSPVVLEALLVSLVKEAGVSPEDITVYDVSRMFPDYMTELGSQGDLEGVGFVGRDEGAADEAAPIAWSYEFKARRIICRRALPRRNI